MGEWRLQPPCASLTLALEGRTCCQEICWDVGRAIVGVCRGGGRPRILPRARRPSRKEGSLAPVLPGGPGAVTRPGCPEPAAELGSHLGLRMLRLALQQLLGPPFEVSPCAMTAQPLQGLASAARRAAFLTTPRRPSQYSLSLQILSEAAGSRA